MYRAEFAAPEPMPAFGAASQEFRPLRAQHRHWSRWIALTISAALLAASLWQMAKLDLHRVLELVPRKPDFWAIFAIAYLATPLSEWVIFRRLWGLGPSGLLALLRKRISNEILLGYVGDLYFYAWARKTLHLTAAPFAAVKDVAVVSALVGNIATLVVVGLAWLVFGWAALGFHSSSMSASMAVLTVSSVPPLLLRRRLFSLEASELRFITWMQVLRLIATTVLPAVMWHVVLPQVAVSWWLLLSAIRMLISRLPLLPNKDFIFAGLAVLVIGHDAEVSDLLAMMAGLLLATHLVLGAAISLGELVESRFK